MTPYIAKIITLTSNAVGHGETITIHHTDDGGKFSPHFYWYKLPAGNPFLVLMADDHIMTIPIKNQGNYLSSWGVYCILPMLFRFFDKF